MTALKLLRGQLAPAALAMAIALVIASAALLINGDNPITAYQAMWSNLDGTSNLITVINDAAVYYVAGVALALGFKMNLFNIGANGQFTLAALMAGVVGGATRLPALIHVPLVLLVAIAVGAVWAGIAGVLKAYRGVNEVVATIMLNGIAGGLTGYLLRTYFRVEGDMTAHTETLPMSARLPNLDRLLAFFGFNVPGGTPLYSFVLIAIAVGIAFRVLIYRTRFGFDLRASGINPDAARSSGVDPKRMILITMLLSGGLAGLSAMSTLMAKQFEYGDRFPTQVGFTAIGIALLGQNHPTGIAIAALVYAAIEQGARNLATVDVPAEIGQILQGSLLFVAVCVYAVTVRRNQARDIESAARAAAASHAPPGSSAGGHGSAGPIAGASA
jgi:general nucleoside transport system permease protein